MKPFDIPEILLEGTLTRATEGSVGYDLRANDDYTLPYGTTTIVQTGVRLDLKRYFNQLRDQYPPGTLVEAQIRPRSSMSKRGFLVHLGTVDYDYTGELGVCITNLNTRLTQDNLVLLIERGDRIAQLVFNLVFVGQDTPASLSPRGNNGFGSSGK